MNIVPILLSGLVIFCSFTLESITGFGCAVMAMPFVTALLGMKEGVIVITILALLLALWIVAFNYKDINWKEFGKIILFMFPGLPVGMYLQRIGNQQFLKTILAVFILAVSGIKLAVIIIANLTHKEAGESKVRWYSYLALFGAGIIHGMFSSGGPLAIIYTAAAIKDKRQFRATLCLLWTALNIILVATYLIEGSVTALMGKELLALLPFMFLGIFAGEKIHSKVNDKVFSVIVYIALFLTGIFMLI